MSPRFQLQTSVSKLFLTGIASVAPWSELASLRALLPGAFHVRPPCNWCVFGHRFRSKSIHYYSTAPRGGAAQSLVLSDLAPGRHAQPHLGRASVSEFSSSKSTEASGLNPWSLQWSSPCAKGKGGCWEPHDANEHLVRLGAILLRADG